MEEVVRSSPRSVVPNYSESTCPIKMIGMMLQRFVDGRELDIPKGKVLRTRDLRYGTPHMHARLRGLPGVVEIAIEILFHRGCILERVLY